MVHRIMPLAQRELIINKAQAKVPAANGNHPVLLYRLGCFVRITRFVRTGFGEEKGPIRKISLRSS